MRIIRHTVTQQQFLTADLIKNKHSFTLGTFLGSAGEWLMFPVPPGELHLMYINEVWEENRVCLKCWAVNASHTR